MRIYKVLPVALLLLSASCGGGNSSTNTNSGTSQPVADGKTIFINNCAQCHDIKQDKNAPKLEGSIARWNNDTARLIKYIRNSQEVIKSDPYAAKLYKDWSNMIMPPFPDLTDAEIKNLLDYIAKGED